MDQTWHPFDQVVELQIVAAVSRILGRRVCVDRSIDWCMARVQDLGCGSRLV